MMIKTQEYTPISAIGPADGPGFADLLPGFAPVHEVGIDMARVGRIARWGGFEREVEIIPFSGPTSNISGGFREQRDGSYRGAYIPQMVPLGVGEPERESIDLWRTRTPLRLWVNTNELTQRVQHSGVAIREPNAWSDHLHDALAEGLVSGARANLIAGRPKGEFLTSLGVIGVDCGILGPLLSADNLSQAPITFGLLAAAALASVPSIHAGARSTHELPFDGGVYSILPVKHYDRLAVVRGLTKLQRLTTKYY